MTTPTTPPAKPRAKKLTSSAPATALPEELAALGKSLPEVLLPYQRELVAKGHERTLLGRRRYPVIVYEKSRRIGVTWGVAADAVLTAAAKKRAGGMDVLYIGYSLDLAREFVDTAGMWAKAFAPAVSEVKEFLFNDGKGSDGVQAFRIDFASGFSIVALSSRPRSLRGRQGYVIIDEAAFHDDLPGLMKAALALLIWGGRVLVISSHNGVDHPFAQLVAECRAGKKPYPVLRTTFADAVAVGLFRRVCLTGAMQWSPEAEAEWVKEIRDQYGDDAGEELDVVPRQSGGKFLTRTLLESRATGGPVLRLALPPEWVDKPEETRIAEINEWLREHVEPLLASLGGAVRSFVGEDFGRSGDLSIQWPLLLGQDLRRRTPFVIELRNVPFRAQEQILFFLCDRLPRFSGAALDARGNGQYLAEVTRQRYGAECVAEVMLSEGWYREHMPRMKSALEDDTFNIPQDADVVDDFRSIEVVNGVGRVPDAARKTAGGQRHGDGAIAGCLALAASNTLDAGPLEASVAGQYESLGAFGEHAGDTTNYAGWNDL